MLILLSFAFAILRDLSIVLRRIEHECAVV